MIGFCSSVFTAPFATQFSPETHNYPIENLCFLGLAAIMDPPRDDAQQAVETCINAGIKVFMVTGTNRIQFIIFNTVEKMYL